MPSRPRQCRWGVFFSRRVRGRELRAQRRRGARSSEILKNCSQIRSLSRALDPRARGIAQQGPMNLYQSISLPLRLGLCCDAESARVRRRAGGGAALTAAARAADKANGIRRTKVAEHSSGWERAGRGATLWLASSSCSSTGHAAITPPTPPQPVRYDGEGGRHDTARSAVCTSILYRVCYYPHSAHPGARDR